MNGKEAQSGKDTFKIFIRLTGMVKPFKGLLSASVGCGILGQLSSIGLLAFAASAAAIILTEGFLPVFAVAAAILCGLVRGVLRYGEHYLGHDIAFRLLFNIRKEIFRAVNRLAPAKLLDRKSGDISTTVMADVEYIETFFAHTLAPVLIGFFVSAVVLVAAGIINIRVSAVLLPFYLLSGLVLPLLSFRSAADSGFRHRRRLSEMNSRMVESLQGLMDLMLLGRDKEMLDSLLKNSGNSDESYKRIRANEGTLAAFAEITLGAAAAAVISLSAFLVHRGIMTTGEAVFTVVLSLTSFGPMIGLMFLSNSLVNTAAAARRVFALIDEKPAVENLDEDTGERVSGFTVQSAPILGNVDFSYPGTNAEVLSGFSLRTEKGKISALKAGSGRGKSTVLYLMIRFFDPDTGTVVLGDHSLKRYDLDELRCRISYFTQNTILFNISVMENIRIADRSASDEEVYLAAEKAGIHDFISLLPEGYMTSAGEQGNRFSSGEKQRIGLARVFLQDNGLILLDEPVSNLDSENEKLIMNNFKSGVSGKTVILVSHRKSVIDIADTVIEV